MGTLYLTEPGTKLRKASRRLIVEKEGTTILEMPLFKVDRVMLFGGVQITSSAIGLLLDQGIDVSFMTGAGKLRGRLVSSDSLNVFLRLAQHDRVRDESFRLRFSRAVITGKIRNQRFLLMRYLNNHPEKADLQRHVQTLDQMLNAVPCKKTVPSLLGIEGVASGAWFRCFGAMLQAPFEFRLRTRRPPRDPVNALLSLGYVLLTSELAALVESAGFDPFIGFLHTFHYGRRSLPLDLVEEFRHPLIDMLVLNVVNRKMLSLQDFQTSPEGACLLGKDSLKKYLSAYEDFVSRARDDENRSFRSLLRSQVEKLEEAVLHGREYEPYSVR